MKKFLNPRGINILDALDAVDRRYDVTPAQISLAWLTSRPDVTAPIASATTLDQLQKILGATEVELDAETVGKLEGASV